MVTRVGGRRVFTPLFLVFIALGSTDILFALDSIPAVFGVTEEAFIVFAANAFALLGLRALYLLVTGLLDRLVYLATGYRRSSRSSASSSSCTSATCRTRASLRSRRRPPWS
jgi:hypothetical protein